jgi:hypothetical protein
MKIMAQDLPPSHLMDPELEIFSNLGEARDNRVRKSRIHNKVSFVRDTFKVSAVAIS